MSNLSELLRFRSERRALEVLSSEIRLDSFSLLIFLFSATAFKLSLDVICNLEVKWQAS